MRISFGKPTWRGVYAHALLLTFYFLLSEVLIGVIGGSVTGTFMSKSASDLVYIAVFSFMSMLLIHLLRKTFPELKHWFIPYIILMFFFRLYLLNVYGV